MDHSIRQRAPFTLRNQNTQQECEFHDQAEVDSFRAEVKDAGAWELIVADGSPATGAPAAASEAQQEAQAAPEAPAAAPAVTEEAPAPAAPARKSRAAKK